MKLRGKLIISYIALLTLVFVIFYLVSMPLVRNYIRNRVSDSLDQESKLIKTRLVEAMDDVTDRESYINALAKSRIAIERLGLSSSISAVYYNKNTDTINIVQDISLDSDTSGQLKDNIINKDGSIFTGKINGEKNMMLVFPAGTLQNQQHVFILVYTPETALETFTRGFTRIMVVVFTVTTLIAIMLSFFLAQKMTGPIDKLKKQAEKLRKRDFSAKSNIVSGDEFRDLSDALNSAAEELEAYNKAQKEFLDNVSHELKTPLMSIQGYAEGIRDGVFTADDKTLGIIVDESIRLKSLVEDISYLSKLESTPDFYNFEELDAGEIIRRAVDAVSGLGFTMGKGIVVLDAPGASIRGDREKLTQLFLNIISNGIRYAEKSVFIEGSVKENEYVVSIRDDGPGLPPGEEHKVFRRFYKGVGGNTGLGLAISSAIALIHGGHIEARNISPHGAIFIVSLPIIN